MMSYIATRKHLIWIVAVLVSVLTLVLISFLGFWPISHVSSETSDEWQSIQSKIRDTRVNLRTVVVGKQKAVVSAPFEARIVKVAVNIGDVVAKGESLLTLDDVAMKIQLKQATEAFRKANVLYLEAIHWKDSPAYTSALKQLRSEEINLSRAKSKVEQAGILYEKGIIAKDERDQTEVDLELITSQVDRAKEAKAAIERKLANESIDAARADFDNARAKQDELSYRLRNSTVKSPISGVVTQIGIRSNDGNSQEYEGVGARATEGTIVATIVDISEIYLVGLATESIKATVSKGVPVEITTAARPDATFTGIVDSIETLPMESTKSDLIDDSKIPRFKITIRVNSSPDAENKPIILGTQAEVSIKVSSNSQPKLLAPLDSIHTTQAGEHFVWVRGSTRKKVTVTVGETTETSVYVEANQSDDLKLGDEVLIVRQNSSASDSPINKINLFLHEWLNSPKVLN